MTDTRDRMRSRGRTVGEFPGKAKPAWGNQPKPIRLSLPFAGPSGAGHAASADCVVVFRWVIRPLLFPRTSYCLRLSDDAGAARSPPGVDTSTVARSTLGFVARSP